MRDEVVDYVSYWRTRAEAPLHFFVKGLGVSRGKLGEWKKRYGRRNCHNGEIPRDFWIPKEEQEKILNFSKANPENGYRRLAYMMIDQNIAYVAPSTAYRILKGAGYLQKWGRRQGSRKGKGFEQPLKAHEHWHIDISYINIAGTFYYLASVLDGYSRMVLGWEIKDSMKEVDIEILLQKCCEKYPDASPRIISDNGPQFIANDFKSFIRLTGMTHVRTSPFYPQSNGKVERYQKTAKQERIRKQVPLSLEEARRLLGQFIERYNNERLHSAIGYVTPADMLAGRQKEIHAERDRKLETARIKRRHEAHGVAA